ncbi:MAG TPA: hypothetical protein PKE06_05255 [Flavilitoribacter sp.]|nr:hypothetical protein [Flavilitoribacter sp.]HMQ88805.1 hypothetical protein [Flavilitoribacter sp.]
MKKRYLILVFGLAAVWACRKDFEETVIIKSDYTPSVVRVTGNIMLKVEDEAGNPIENAPVFVDNESGVTGTGGVLQFRDIDLNANGTLVKADLPGYFHGSKRIYPRENSTNYVTLTLMPIQQTELINVGAGGGITLDGGARIEIPANAIVHPDGTIPAEARISARWLDPTAENLGQIMPGGLQGISTDGKEVALLSYGMLAVELTTSSGEKLALAEGVKATLHFPIPAGLKAGAPEKIALWHMDEDTGYWREEGQALRSGDEYIGEVSHFSFWNCDFGFDFVNATGRVVTSGRNPLSNLRVEIVLESLGLSAFAYSDAEGFFGGPIPKGQPLILRILNKCSEVVVEQQIGPFDENADLGEFVIEANNYTTLLQGGLVDCEGNHIQNGIVRVCSGNYCQVFLAQSDGTFEITFLYCNSQEDLHVSGIDLDAHLESDPLTLPADQEVSSVALAACGNPLDNYLLVSIGKTVRVYPYIQYFFEPSEGHYFSYEAPVGVFTELFHFGIPTKDTIPNIPITSGISFATMGYWPELANGSCLPPSCDLTVTLTKFGHIGEYIRGTFTGTVLLTGVLSHEEAPYPISGEFSVLRDQ